MEAALAESRGLDHSWDWRALECTLIPAFAALINGAGNLPTPFIRRGRVCYCPTRAGPEWCPRGPADPLLGQDTAFPVWGMRYHCSEGAVLPWNTHPLHLKELAPDSEVRVGPEDHLMWGPAARAQLERAGGRPQLDLEQDQADHSRSCLWDQGCLLLLT